ncbi:serine/threonine-protein kinase [Demequina lutea]|uniref:non-specific serine/threonine protein kinase n=1 Tax=Demequina lutea TaxID=431489 RepID=A0A7Y9Z962_9MICO|nr:serine/threonine-protein kinase [Demequina lutea]NYI40550.1 putative Ser/Thr protein kinase [Demequina lutea]
MAGRALHRGDEVGGYIVERPLGSGGSGQVYLVRNAEGAAVALKRVDAQHDEVAAERLRREVRALMAVRHPAVPRVLDAELEDDDTFVVFEFIEGECLADEVAARGPLEGEDLAYCAERIAGALEAAHAAGLVHRDVTPSNVMMSPAGAVLIDFGLSHRADDSRLTREGLVSGTAGYVAPEVIDGAEPGADADRWAWAATMAFAMTGKAPYGTGNSAIRKTLQGKWSVPDLPGAEVLAAALDRKVEERPGMRDIVAAMRGATAILPVEALAATAVMETSSDGTEVLAVNDPELNDGEFSDGDDFEDGWRTVDFDGHVLNDMVLPGRETLEGDLELAMRRPVLVAAWATAVAASAAVAPFAGAAVVIIAALVARTVFRRGEALRIARARRGERRRDSVLHTLGVPWHLIRAAAELLPSLIVAALIGTAVGALGWYLVSIGAVATSTPDGQGWGHAIAIAVGLLAFEGALWWGLWSWTTREGSYRVAESLAPTNGVSGAWIVVALIIFGSASLAVYVGADPWWWPLPAMPQSGG